MVGTILRLFTYSDSAATYWLCEGIRFPFHEHIAYTLTLNPNRKL